MVAPGELIWVGRTALAVAPAAGAGIAALSRPRRTGGLRCMASVAPSCTSGHGRPGSTPALSAPPEPHKGVVSRCWRWWRRSWSGC